MAIEKVIVLEDELVVRKSLAQQLHRRRCDVAEAPSLEKAKEFLRKDEFDLVFVDIRLPDGDGRELLEFCRQQTRPPLLVIMTMHATIESAVECMQNGAFDYLIKPFSSDQIEIVLKKANEYRRLLQVNQHLNRDDSDGAAYEIIGQSPAIQALNGLIRKVARTEATVLIQGESGTGKELVARSIFRQSPRSEQPFITVNCAAVPESLVESEFFGHEKGAFTGAANRREGRFELAHGGTLLLDEVSEVSAVVQSKLLRVLQERELERVGGNRTIKVDVRVIATTNRDLAQSVEDKEFRQDLYFRLNVVPIMVPPLRERQGDVMVLADHFLRRFARKHRCQVVEISEASKNILSAYPWPGNVRELQNVIERAVILSQDEERIEPDALGLSIMPSKVSVPSISAEVAPTSFEEPEAAGAPESADENPPFSAEIISLASLEKQHILNALRSCGNNKTRTAEKLGISIRTLRNKLNEYRAQGWSEEAAE